jgi:endonuclease-3
MVRKTKAVMDRVNVVCERLDNEYGTDTRTYLDHRDAFELLIATILSAQCTDKRVNMVTPQFPMEKFYQEFTRNF